jgi:hypothetical protein
VVLALSCPDVFVIVYPPVGWYLLFVVLHFSPVSFLLDLTHATGCKRPRLRLKLNDFTILLQLAQILEPIPYMCVKVVP